MYEHAGRRVHRQMRGIGDGTCMNVHVGMCVDLRVYGHMLRHVCRYVYRPTFSRIISSFIGCSIGCSIECSMECSIEILAVSDAALFQGSSHVPSNVPSNVPSRYWPHPVQYWPGACRSVRRALVFFFAPASRGPPRRLLPSVEQGC